MEKKEDKGTEGHCALDIAVAIFLGAFIVMGKDPGMVAMVVVTVGLAYLWATKRLN